MKKGMHALLLTLLLVFSVSSAQAARFFEVTESGEAITADVILCLNAKGPVSCQHYRVSAATLSIRSLMSRNYPAAGIKSTSPKIELSGCTPYPNGYCIFALQAKQSTTVNVKVTSPGSSTYRVGGSLTGLVGQITLTINDRDSLTLDSNGTFTFPTVLETGSAYSVSVLAQPATKICSVSQGNGTIGTADISNIIVSCVDRGLYTLTTSGDGNVVFSPSSAQVYEGSTQTFTVNASSGYRVNQTVGGTCPSGSWSGNTYTTGTIIGDCAVSFSGVPLVTITSNGDGNVSFSPGGQHNVDQGSVQVFTLTPNSGYRVNQSVGGTCPVGSWTNSNTYQTAAITSDCTVSFSGIPIATITPSGDGNVGFSPNAQQTIDQGTALTFTLTPNSGYRINQTVGGTCPSGSWTGNVYTTGTITSDCTVSFSGVATASITPSGDAHVGFTPSSGQTVDQGTTKDFTVTASSGYRVNQTVGGTCPTGSWNGSIYTTGTIASDCTVSFSGVATASITPSGDAHVSFTPSSSQTVDQGTTKDFTVTASSGYRVNQTVGGTCPSGSWNGSIYTTGTISNDCTVSFSGIATATVTPSGDGRISFLPNSVQTVDQGTTQGFTVTANSGYRVNQTVGGTCPSGSWNGGSYTTGIITSNCTVSFSGVATATVTPSGDINISFTPSSVQTVDQGMTKDFTVTANSGYGVNQTVGGTCPLGSWASSTYTTGTITSNCTVSFSSLPLVTVTPSVDGYVTISPNTSQTVTQGTPVLYAVSPSRGML